MAQLADATVNPFTTSFGGYTFIFNGTTWDRQRSIDSWNSGATAKGFAGVIPAVFHTGTAFAPLVSPNGVGDGSSAQGMPGVHQYVYNGATYDRTRVPKTFKPLSAVAVGTEATIWTPAAGKKFRIMGLCVSVGTAAGNVTLKDNTAGTTILVLPKAPLDAPFFMEFGNGILSAAANNVLTATGVATATLSGTIWGTEE